MGRGGIREAVGEAQAPQDRRLQVAKTRTEGGLLSLWPSMEHAAGQPGGLANVGGTQTPNEHSSLHSH